MVSTGRAAARRRPRRDRARLPARGRRNRGSALLPASRHRSDRRRPRRLSRCPRRRRRRRREHADPAARPHAVSVEHPVVRPQSQGSRHRAAHRGPADQERDPRAVPQSRVPERGRLRRRDDVRASVSEAGPLAHAGGVGVHCRPSPRSGGAFPLVELRGCARAQRRGARGDARAGIHHAGSGSGREGCETRRCSHFVSPRTPAPDGPRNTCDRNFRLTLAAIIRRTGRSIRRSGPIFRRLPSALFRRACSASTGRDSRRRLSPSIR